MKIALDTVPIGHYSTPIDTAFVSSRAPGKVGGEPEMTTYIARYTQTSNSNTVPMALAAETDAMAVAEVRKIVEAGYRNETACQVTLQDRRVYGAVNQHGNAVGGYV